KQIGGAEDLVVEKTADHDVDGDQGVDVCVDDEHFATAPQAMDEGEGGEGERNHETKPPSVTLSGKNQGAPKRQIRSEMFEERFEIANGANAPIDLPPCDENCGAGEGAQRKIGGGGEEDLGAAFDSHPGCKRSDRQRQQRAGAEHVGADAVHNRQQQEMSLPFGAEDAPLMLDESDVRTYEQRAKEKYRIVDERPMG